MVVKAYAKVRQGGKAAGIDNESWEDFSKKGVEKQLYVIWNRMASGSYYPQAVREVEILKKDGKKRKLGIPTVRDRIAQAVVKHYMEQKVDAQFHPNSYGYRPMKSAKEAIEQVRKNCIEEDWVIDMDISKFFDEISHELMLKAVEAMIPEKWVRNYVERWLQMKVVKADGTMYDRGNKGTPQGGVISPLLANLFLHYGLDKWLEKHYYHVKFVRYADDVVVHCKTKAEAEDTLLAISTRLQEIGLRLNETKTKIVYCKDYRRREEHEQVQFGFLGFSYQPRQVQSKFEEGKSYTGFTAEISKENQKKIRDNIREAVRWRDTSIPIEQIAEQLNSKLRGWLNYFELYSKRQLHKTMLYLERKLLKWIERKHKQGLRKSRLQLQSIKQKKPILFYHWQKGYG
jgi:group II intron reverse transcriptase/maturase